MWMFPCYICQNRKSRENISLFHVTFGNYYCNALNQWTANLFFSSSKQHIYIRNHDGISKPYTPVSKNILYFDTKGVCFKAHLTTNMIHTTIVIIEW